MKESILSEVFGTSTIDEVGINIEKAILTMVGANDAVGYALVVAYKEKGDYLRTINGKEWLIMSETKWNKLANYFNEKTYKAFFNSLKRMGLIEIQIRKSLKGQEREIWICINHKRVDEVRARGEEKLQNIEECVLSEDN